MKPAALLADPAGLLSLRVRLATALVATLALLLSLAFRVLFPGVPELPALAALFAWSVVALPVLAGALRGLFHTAQTLNPHYLDQFVALALLGCLAGQRYATGALVAIILVFGQILEERSVRGVREAVEGLGRLARVPARRLREGGVEEAVDTDRLGPGDQVRVLPGELIPADARVLEGLSAVDQSAITGESQPVDVRAGDEVFAGTLNLSGPLLLLTLRASGDTVIGRVRALLAAAGEDRPLVARRVDACLRYYTPAVLLLTGIVWMLSRDLDRAVSVLVICLPCAFLLSGPSVMVAALAVCSRHGVLVKTPRHFETATTLDTVVFDKTGTLTEGRLTVGEVLDLFSDAAPVGAQETGRAELARRLAIRLASTSQHPVARAIASLAGEAALSSPVAEAREVPGRGLRGVLEGHEVLLGSAVWLEENGVRVAGFEEAAGRRTVFAALDGHARIAFALGDTVRPEAREVVSALAAIGVTRALLLTGDHELAARSVAASVGLGEWRARCLPEEKLAAVRALRAEGRRVLVVGDGVNDALALSGGDLGVALNHSGAHIAVQTADVALLHDRLRNLVDFLRISRRALGLVHQNLLVAGVFIVVSLVLTALGLVGPLAAAFLHEAGAFFVLINSSRLLRHET
jgi:heavy metal translocating P-type ATPase